MKEFEYRRTVFYQMRGHESFEDEHKNFDYSIHEGTVVNDAVTYLKDGSSYLRFPGAARAVAIAAADFIAREFNEDFLSILNNPTLMNGNDPFFKTYKEDQAVYDEILKLIPRNQIVWDSPRMAITQRLIREEYMLDQEGLNILPRNSWTP